MMGRVLVKSRVRQAIEEELPQKEEAESRESV